MSDEITITGVSERDIDLLLLEELHSSSSFQEWFISQALESTIHLGRFSDARRSVTDSTGESDLEVDFLTPEGTRIRLLVENKVNAGLQRQQAERYRHRGESYIAAEAYAEYYTVIVAPARTSAIPARTKASTGASHTNISLSGFIRNRASARVAATR